MIQEENVVILESQVMDDVPEGGGAATGRVVPDGALNNVFPDISDLDRAYGRLNLRELFLGVRSVDTDLYGGGKLAMTGLPTDPALAYTLFSIKDQFGTRTDAADRVEAYFYKAGMWHGVLMDGAVAGMDSIRVIQRLGTELPVLGKTLCLVANEGATNEVEQYVRVKEVTAVETTWGEGSSQYTRLVVTLKLKDRLRYDFAGHEPSSSDIYIYTTGRARLRDTTVADATRYYGAQRVAADAGVTDTAIRVASIFTQLVPSSETPTQLVNQPMAGQVVATLDAGGGRMVEVPQTAHTRATPVTAENRRTDWIENLSPRPALGTLNVAYRAQGNWYVLQDDGSGVLAGADPLIGAGTVNAQTGDAPVTLGALPDAGSEIIWTWASPVHYAQRLGALDGKRTIRHLLGEPVQPGSMTLTWLSGGAAKTASVSTAGVISGNGGGYVSQVIGDIRLELDTPADSQTLLGIDYERVTQVEVVLSGVSAPGGLAAIDLGVAIEPGSLECEWSTTSTVEHSEKIKHLRQMWYSTGVPGEYDYYWGVESVETVAGSTQTRYVHTASDDGDGHLGDAGSVAYATGQIVLPVLPEVTAETYASDAWDTQTGSTLHEFTAGIVTVRYTPAGATPTTVETEIALPDLTLRILPRLIAEDVMPGSLVFTLGSYTYTDTGAGTLYAAGIASGQLDYATGIATLTRYGGAGTATVISCLTRYGLWVGTEACFRTALAPLKPEALSITVTAEDGEQLSASADADGLITGAAVSGTVSYEMGVSAMQFGALGPDPENPTGPEIWIARRVDPSTMRYNAVAYSYLPLDADILGVDAVRLPTDGRVPIFRDGDIALIMHAAETAPQTIADGGVISCGRTRLAWARGIDADGVTVSGDLYTLDRAAGTLTFPDVSGLSQPLTVRHVVADLRMVTDAQITGWLKLSRALTHDYPAGEAIVSSCLLFGDRRARVSSTWDQVSWNGTWVDTLVGDPATATLDFINYPLKVTNDGCDTDRWVFRCTNASTHQWELISEHRGRVWSGTYEPYVSGLPVDVAPINPRTRTLLEDGVTYVGGVPYMVIPQRANGGGFGTGNVVRINTVGAIADFWVSRSIQQSDEPADPAAPDGCELYALGNIDRP